MGREGQGTRKMVVVVQQQEQSVVTSCHNFSLWASHIDFQVIPLHPAKTSQDANY
jgi:hypothetical protein